MKAIKAFFSKVWAWVLAHKIVAGVIAGAVTLAIVTAIVVPVSISSARKKRAEQETQQNDGGGSQPATHEHTYADAWSSDATKHWHAATCEHDVKSGEEAHKFGAYSYDSVKGNVTRTCSICGYVDEKNHEHVYVFNSFVWTETPGDYQAKAKYICECGDEDLHDASVTPTSTEPATCGDDGVTYWNAQYDTHFDSKEEVLPHTNAHHHAVPKVDISSSTSVADSYEYTCDVCGHKIYEVELSFGVIYFDYTLISNPTAENEGEGYIQLFEYDSVASTFSLRDDDSDVKSGTIKIPAYVEEGYRYYTSKEYSRVGLNGYLNLLAYGDNKNSLGTGLGNMQKVCKILIDRYNFIYTVDNINQVIDNMKFLVTYYPNYYPDNAMEDLTMKVRRADGFTTHTMDVIPQRSGYTLAGFATSADGPKVYDVGEHVDIGESRVGAYNLYCYWEAV